ncbi:MAG: cell envelope biogenesis protein TolA [Afipia sp.]|nr:cell envelope biogenesis protein TolA [Afipia sp.]
MIKKLFTKYFLEVVPSIVATVVGAYIVTHYINAKSEADKPKAAIAAPAKTSKDAAPQTLKADESADKAAKAESAKAEAARLKAEKLALEKAAAERSAADRAENAKKAAEKLAAEKAASDKAAADKFASDKAAAEKRERTAAKPAPAAPMPAEANAAPDDKRDANDLARAAIERLRNAGPRAVPEPPRAQEAARAEEPAKAQERARVNSVVYAPAAAPQQPSIQPLPPAVTVAPPPSEAAVAAPAPFPQPISGSSDIRADDGLRLTPPADIPSRPLDLRAKQGRTSVTEDVMSAAKSVFHAVVPESN